MIDSPKDTGFGSEQLAKLMENFKVPGVDVQALLNSQHKNIDALSQASHIAADGMAAVSRHQAEFMQTAIEKINAIARDAKLSADERKDVATKAFEMALTNAKELATMSQKASTDVFEVMKKRMTDSFEEMRKAMQPKGD